MAKPTRKYLLQLVAQHGPEIAKAFQASLASIKGSAQVGALITMLEKGDIEGAMVAAGLDQASFRRLDQSIANAFEDGGGKTAQTIPVAKTPDGLRMVVQFNARNDRAEQWLKDHSSTLIREILDDQRQVIRQTLADGLARGQNPKTIARALIGDLDKATGRRVGGTIGLTAHQQRITANYLDELLSGDPAKMRNALARALRDPKFDAAIRRAIAAGTPLDPDLANKAAARYRDRQLVLRAETIGRTEAMTALHQSQEEAYQQAIDKGALQAQHVRYFWRTAADERVRHSHAMIPGMNEKGVPHGHPFSSPLGPIRYPGDPKASAANRLGCRCWREPRVDFLAQAVEAERGPMASPAPSAEPRAPRAPAPTPEHSWPWTPRPRQSPVDLKMIRNPEEFGLFADEAGALRLANELMAGVPESIVAHASWTKYIPFPGADPELKFRLREDDVTLVRTFRRENNRLIVEHDYFELDEKYKGGGHAIRMLQASLAAYDRLGVNEIHVHANLDMGGYVWARNGFRASDPATQRLVFKYSAQRQLRQGLMTEARFTMLMEVLNTSSDLELMYNIAVLKDDGVEFGKEFLLESDWWGLADLDDPEHRALLAKAVSR